MGNGKKSIFDPRAGLWILIAANIIAFSDHTLWVELALVAIDEGDTNLPALASLAKATAGDTLHAISSQMVQLHGGIGMTHEHDAGLYLKRARVAEQCYGSTAWHRERWARLNGY